MIAKIKEYKEVITFLLLFIGGFFWLHNTYPTKDDLGKETKILKCLLEKYMQIHCCPVKKRTISIGWLFAK